LLTRWHDRELYVAAIESVRHAGAGILHEMNFDAGVPASVLRQEIYNLTFDRLRRRAYPQDSRFAALESACPFAKRCGIGQQSATAIEEIFALRGQPHPPPHTVEKLDAHFGLKRVYLPGCRRLRDIESCGCAANAAGFDDRDERMEVTEVHFLSYIFRIELEILNSLDT